MTSPEHASRARGLGKIILLGEHAVVYGHKAVAGAIDRGVACEQEPSEGASRLRIPDWRIDVQVGDEHPVARAFDALLSAAECSKVDVRARTDLPAAAGLGSSAALCVAIARSLRPDLTGDALRVLASVGEECFHERPSGIDVALSCAGGIGIFTRSAGLHALACPSLPLVVGLSGVQRSTAAMVAGVAGRVADGGQAKAQIERIGTLAEAGQQALLSGKLELLGGLMSECHQALQDLGVSINALDTMVEVAGEAGALGAKLTGAGGGGAMIALAPGREPQVREALQSRGFDAFITTLGATP